MADTDVQLGAHHAQLMDRAVDVVCGRPSRNLSAGEGSAPGERPRHMPAHAHA